MVWCDGNSHHPIVSEVEEGEEGHKVEPEEFGCRPFKAHHSIHNECVVCSLNKYVRYFYDDLHIRRIQVAKVRI